MTKTSAPSAVRDLIARYRREQALFHSGALNEAHLRRDFIEPLLASLGWQVGDSLQKDVGFAGQVSYEYVGTFGLFGQFGVAIRAPTLNLRNDDALGRRLIRDSAQVGMSFVLLTNFEELVCYDCEASLLPQQSLSSARIFSATFEEYTQRWPELSALLSRSVLEESGFSPRTDIENDARSGIDEASSGASSIEPVQFARTEQTILQLYSAWKDGDELELPERLQRGPHWSLVAQSRFVESVLLRFPLPAIYLAERARGRARIVIDGQRRLSTLFRFLDGDFALQGLRLMPELNGRDFLGLDSKLRRRFEDASMTAFVILTGSDRRLEPELFRRLNPTWSDQEVRQVFYRGPGLNLVEELSAPGGLFRQVAGSRRVFRRSLAQELTLRVLAFLDKGFEPYRGDMDDFLTEALVRLNALPDSSLHMLRERMLHALDQVEGVFGDDAFRRFDPGSGTALPHLNVALMDVMTWGFGRFEEGRDWKRQAGALRKGAQALQEDEAFVDSITRETGSVAKVNTRFQLWKEMLQDVASHHP